MNRYTLSVFLLLSTVVIVITAAFLGPAVAALQTVTPTPPPATISTDAPTTVSVYVLSWGGKYIGDDIGGAQVTIRDAHSQAILAQGRTHGGSGSAAVMSESRPRTEPLSLEDAAIFTATLAIDEPELVEVEAFGPLAGPGSANRVTATQWILPDALMSDANKITLEVPGLNVDVLDPPTHFMPATKPPLDITLRVNVPMMCGCPIGPELDWKPQNYTVKALIKKPDGTQDVMDLQFDTNAPEHAPSQFIGKYTATESGVYQAIVFAHQAEQYNNGSTRVTIILP